jgi:hypothetical protein
MDISMGVAAVIVAALVTSCDPSSVAASRTGASRSGNAIDGRVLFIGNSLTEANGLPAMVETLARQGGAPLTTASVHQAAVAAS